MAHHKGKPGSTKLADALHDRYGSSLSPWMVGTVKSVSGSAATVTILGDDYVGLHSLASYTPAVADVVLILGGGGQLFILGKITP